MAIVVSRDFIIALKLHYAPAYKVCQEAGVDQNFISRAINGIIKVPPMDERVLRVGHVLGLDPSLCFEATMVENKDNDTE